MLHTLFEWCIQPFIEFDFMRRALVAVVCLALGAAPLGVLLLLRRMSLVGDAISHGILPGVALGYIAAGYNLWAMGLGGLLAGLAIAIAVGIASRITALQEDANFAAFYLGCLALGVALVSRYGSQVELLHLLFGSVLAIDHATLTLVTTVASITLLALGLSWRGLLVYMTDPLFLHARTGFSLHWHIVLLVLVVMNLVAGFQSMGTLMGVGLMMLPAIIARLWAKSMEGILLLAVSLAVLSGYAGLLVSYHVELPSGPAIILFATVVYMISLIVGKQGGWLAQRLIYTKHVEKQARH